MTAYKNFCGTREEYVNHLKERLTFWAKKFSEESRTDLRYEIANRMENAAQQLSAEGMNWDEIEAIETAAMA